MTQTLHIPFDYHMHSNNSYDARHTMREMCQSALEKGVPEIAFTEHFNAKPEDFCYGRYNAERYFRDLENCRAEFGPQGLTIKAGLEVGEMHLYRAEADALLNNYPYDIVLGSLHWNNGESVFERPYFQKRDHVAAAREYFTEMREMVEAGGFNILSHLDVPKRMGYNVYGKYDLREYEEFVRPVLQACVKQGIAPEINTSALRLPVNQTHPTIDALLWYRELGGELLTIGSDAHRPSDLAAGLDKAVTMAVEAGFTQLARFEKRQAASFVEISTVRLF
jgi:histidinol-phosphatase (PHP family)